MLREFPVAYYPLKNGETLAYRKAGNKGEVLLLIHGNMSSSVHYDTVMEELEHKYRIYAVDLRGFGDSTYNTPVNSLRDFALDVEEFMTGLDLKDVNLAGWSTGGGVVLETAADLPERVKKVILIESVGIKGYPMFRKDEKGQPILSELLTEKEEIASDPVQVVPAVTAHNNQDSGYYRWIYNLVIYNHHQPEAKRYERYLDAILKQRNLVDVDYALVHFNMTPDFNGVCTGSGRINDIKCPVLIIQGENDLVVPKAFSEETKRYLGDKAELKLFKDSGHSPLSDKFAEFIETVTDFIDK